MHQITATPVRLDSSPRPVGALLTRVLEYSPRTVDEAMATAIALSPLAQSPGGGSTRDLWEALATVAAHDLGAARVIEPHLDALAILEQAGAPDGTATSTATWGVFAAEGGNDPLVATRVFGGDRPDGWLLTGTKPWCSLADRLDRALVSARGDDDSRRLFSVSLAGDGVRVDTNAWHARGLVEIASGPVRFDAVVAEPIGEAGWYLSRPGFAWGGIGVAACWLGGAIGIARTVFASARVDAPFVVMHLGAIDELVESSRRALADAADLIDSGTVSNPRVLAQRVRATVARACEEIIDRAGHALGPAPLALDAEHAKRVADLQLYVRQHHAERDQHSLGAALLAAGGAPW